MSTPALIHPVILCGGSGTRLWPVSRKQKPKPFLPLIGKRTLFQQAVARVTGSGRFAPPIVVAGAQHCGLIEDQLSGVPDYRLIVEPEGKNTAPAIAVAAARLPSDAIMLVCPSDHHIADDDAFRRAALAAADLASEDWMVSFGIAPERPETGYGYLHRGKRLADGFQIAEFVEKPDLATAKAYLASGEYSWNGGIFAFRAGALLNELNAHRPAMAQAVAAAVAAGREEGARFHPQAEAFGEIDGESIDYAVMENTDRAAMVPVDMGWSDIGNWAALHDALGAGGEADRSVKRDELGNVTRGKADLDKTCRNVLAVSDGPRISAIGVEDVCIVVADGEVLVTTREGAQRVGKLPGASQQ
ncbi:MAG: sugar phosphate nucleotidyltransferase [Erythrobacter sp.]|uniref:mannose-1-phosphate guanylyltransferase n=1 Tax=Erythrobacter sp. TaxID=1042 RepID=UPI00260924C4|nr:sugar phosphate nucleotidyltransferase [Erythrobacter sp.]MDJ0979052.1 sugar phosphate nucleotidyltransferase [Erythrobacter sp.]